jgi:hypothetical protein
MVSDFELTWRNSNFNNLNHTDPTTQPRQSLQARPLPRVPQPSITSTTMTVKLDGGARHTGPGLETQMSPTPSVRFFYSFLYILHQMMAFFTRLRDNERTATSTTTPITRTTTKRGLEMHLHLASPVFFFPFTATTKTIA